MELFESRRNIEDLALVLQEWKKDHPTDQKVEYIDELLDKLEYMHMVW